MPNTRVVLCLGLLCYCAGLFALAIWPRDEITWAEWLVAVLSVVAAFGLIAHATDMVELPGERYAYLITGFTGFTALMLYLLDAPEATYREVRVTLLLLSGVLLGYGAHLTEDDDG